MNVHVVPKMCTGFNNARIGNVKRISQYDLANVGDIKHSS